MSRRPSRWRLSVGGLLVLCAACSVLGPRQVVVSAAASLAEPFQALEAAYEADHPDIDVVLNLGGGQLLAAQAVAGAPADLIAVDGPQPLDAVVAAGLGIGDPIRFARNRMVLVVAEGNPQRIAGIEDLVDVVVVLAAPEAPAGRYARQVLAAAGVDLAPGSEEPDVRAAVARVAAGQADATLAYRTDALAVAGVGGVAIPDDLQPEVAYEALLLTDAAGGFLEFLVDGTAQQVLREAGFAGP